jgi:hypothetical protein
MKNKLTLGSGCANLQPSLCVHRLIKGLCHKWDKKDSFKTVCMSPDGKQKFIMRNFCCDLSLAYRKLLDNSKYLSSNLL